ncbi:uncharacterized protein KY384_007267 [Bacidia gigantensis]|uniref:uncharacterized protein n=1 Tax=Bacidia gigantensis TaxID=2732470 RepID=UPI001D045C20|nr:uncharacterized protein KY384_007267 [Bacidia gigantensis]KAG8528349.1 hypothetical protein KY384_007267 [Bacidia gigantensis]
MAPRIFDARTELILLEHLEQHKGENGLYSLDSAKACTFAFNRIKETIPDSAVTPKRIQTRLSSKLARCQSSGRSVYTLYRSGPAVLSPSYRNQLYNESNGVEFAKTLVNMNSTNVPSETGRRILDRPSRARHGMRTSSESTGRLLPASQVNVTFDLPRGQTPSFSPISPYLSHTSAHDPAIMRSSEPTRSDAPTQTSSNVQNLGSQEIFSIKQRQTLTLLEGYIEQDSEAFSCGQPVFSSFQANISATIERTAKQLLQQASQLLGITIASLSHQHPRLARTLRNKGFLTLCKAICPHRPALDMREKLLKTGVTTEEILQGLLAAAIHIHVLDNYDIHDLITKQLLNGSEIDHIYKRTIAKISPKLAQQAWLESKSIYIKEHLMNHDRLSSHSTTQQFTREPLNVRTLCDNLAADFDDTMTVFLEENDLFTAAHSNGEWRHNLRNTFEMAVKLKAFVELGARKEYFYLPKCDDVFDRTILRTEQFLGDGAGEGRRVKLGMFPALRKHSDTVGEKRGEEHELAVVHGLVLLQ